MESFVYTDLNIACRSKDENKIKSFGAFISNELLVVSADKGLIQVLKSSDESLDSRRPEHCVQSSNISLRF